MIDETVQKLAGAVMEGKLTSSGPLLDRLAELGDQRYYRLNLLLADLVTEAALPDRSTRRRSAEEVAYRKDERSFGQWERFTHEFRRGFWAELNGTTALEALEKTERMLNAPKQAARLAAPPRRDDDEETEDSGPMMGNMKSSNSGTW